MSIANYGDLKTEVASTLHRSDLTARVPNFINNALQRVNMELAMVGGILDQEAIATTSTVAAQESYALPTDFRSMRFMSVYANGADDPMEQLTYDRMVEVYGRNSGVPEVYDVIASEFYLAPIPNGVYTLTLGYTVNYSALVNDSDTNYLVTSAGDILLYGALMSASGWLQADERIPTWGQAYKEALRILIRSDKRARTGNKPETLLVDDTLVGIKRPSIIYGV